MNIREELFKLQDLKYKDFQSKLIPNIDKDSVIGVRVPYIRKLAKEISKAGTGAEFMKSLPHKYYDENMLHGLLICEAKDFDKCISALKSFLPYVDNWAVCDLMNPKVLNNNKKAQLSYIQNWVKSDKPYIIRFGINMLMNNFLSEDFNTNYLKLVSNIKNEDYYVKMGMAWYFATALAKQWDETVKIIESKALPQWVHNKTIQKARESYRITKEQKAYLKSLKV